MYYACGEAKGIMIGSITGDIIGSAFEQKPVKTTDFPLFSAGSHFTDDTVLTAAVAYSILNQVDYANTLKYFGRIYPNAGYGGSFLTWLISEDNKPYNSWGNGSAMRVSPVGMAFASFDTVLKEAQKCAEVTHNHPEGIKGAKATAAAVYLAKSGKSKSEIRKFIEDSFNYNLNRTLDEIRPGYSFHVSCQESVPEAMIAFLESDSVEDAIRKAISLGGDSDTLASIAGGIAYAFYKTISPVLVKEIYNRLDPFLIEIITEFDRKYPL